VLGVWSLAADHVWGGSSRLRPETVPEPLVFLARLNAIGVIPYVVLLALVSIGGDFAAQNAGLTSKFTLLLVGLTLLFMAATEWVARRAALGGSYLPGGALRRRKGAE